MGFHQRRYFQPVEQFPLARQATERPGQNDDRQRQRGLRPDARLLIDVVTKKPGPRTARTDRHLNASSHTRARLQPRPSIRIRRRSAFVKTSVDEPDRPRAGRELRYAWVSRTLCSNKSDTRDTPREGRSSAGPARLSPRWTRPRSRTNAHRPAPAPYADRKTVSAAGRRPGSPAGAGSPGLLPRNKTN